MAHLPYRRVVHHRQSDIFLHETVFCLAGLLMRTETHRLKRSLPPPGTHGPNISVRHPLHRPIGRVGAHICSNYPARQRRSQEDSTSQETCFYAYSWS